MKQTRIRKHTRHLLTGLGLFLLASLQPLLAQQNEAGQAAPVKLGLMLPYSGTYAPLGESITNGLKLAIKQNGDQLGGRPVEYVVLDSEADASKAPQNMSRLVKGDKVDVVIGPVHSGVAMGMLKVAKQTGAIMIIPNAGLGAATGQLCMPNVFRTSFSMWQDSYPMGKVAYDRGHRKVVTITWNYAGGKEDIAGFEESFTKAGGEIVKQILVPFPETQFQPYLTDIASIKPDAVYTFFAGAGAVRFVRDYAKVGLKDSVPLLGSGFLTDGNLDAQGEAAEGILTTLHYADGLDSDVDRTFREAYGKAYERELDTYAVQGYDAGMMLVQALDQTDGDSADRDALISALASVKLNSPRGPVTFSKAHHPIQNIYLRQVKGGRNQVIDVASRALEDPARGCRM
ncbi:ABC transporter substrate-binding protein [Alloalcanivorax xenomutans]|jgi:branched-chain amino acid transport system substrate-binding protein|uniref:ABC transporter substrate-binding protein n=1 Tax=Alloalcanivorax xenomutans TaxID=1094342 RepID=A0A9Q3W6H6_9GAMM|nr:ABC transporter substrate-binding protein [Alloalcanivorax xenomutans]MCE7509197.1 ABC transporter substrate-binding protein [Alloalcanivorax xenomutans]MCE7525163.1 ABC transporter substrate-binding protein [Alloalcanivorax xenomutans]SOB97462.1 amino acid/amide ABC transporter substrate-binding protein (HAAT family) [Alloalcanivorax xenomutans]